MEKGTYGNTLCTKEGSTEKEDIQMEWECTRGGSAPPTSRFISSPYICLHKAHPDHVRVNYAPSTLCVSRHHPCVGFRTSCTKSWCVSYATAWGYTVHIHDEKDTGCCTNFWGRSYATSEHMQRWDDISPNETILKVDVEEWLRRLMA